MDKAYFSHKSHAYAFKNKVQEAVFKFLKENDRIHFRDLERFKAFIIAGIDNLNKAHPRNKPVEVHWYQGYKPDFDDWHLEMPGICNYHIYQVRYTKREDYAVQD